MIAKLVAKIVSAWSIILALLTTADDSKAMQVLKDQQIDSIAYDLLLQYSRFLLSC